MCIRDRNKEDAMDRCKWRKVVKEVRWSGWVWVGECFFWYRPTRVVPDQRPLNGCCCCCWYATLASLMSTYFNMLQISVAICFWLAVPIPSATLLSRYSLTENLWNKWHITRCLFFTQATVSTNKLVHTFPLCETVVYWVFLTGWPLVWKTWKCTGAWWLSGKCLLKLH